MVSGDLKLESLLSQVKRMEEYQELEELAQRTVEAMAEHDDLKALHQNLRGHFLGTSSMTKIEKAFLKSLVQAGELPCDVAVQEVIKVWSVLEQEAPPEYDSHLMQVLGLPSTPLNSVSGEVEGRLWGTHRGVEIRVLPNNFSGVSGVMVGKGRKDQPDSLFTAERLEKLNKDMVKHMLSGRRLYVTLGNEEWAKELIDTLDLPAGGSPSLSEWRLGLKKLFSKPLTLNLAGVILKTLTLHRPGHLGNFVRSFMCCALETFQKSAGAELLPMALPRGGREESELIAALSESAFAPGPLTDEELVSYEEKAKDLGKEAWLWLQIALMNALYCGGGTSRVLTETMAYPKDWTDAQQEVVKRQREMAAAWVQSEDDKLVVGSWDQLAEDLDHIYTGGRVSKSYPLTLEAIRPTTPGKDQAGRIELAEVVSEEMKPYVLDPGLVRIPDDEVVHPRTSASVQVSSQQEWDRIVEYLVEARMLEREKPEETLRYKGVAVRNGAFGVHKGWILKEDQTWLRSLRLIINLIPSNGFQRRVPTKPSQKMGYGPSWGALYLHDDEVLLCCAEDQKHCFHIYRPGYAWRGYFVLNRKASGAAFNDGITEAAFPRVRSAPMGWNNVVDFIQDGFESLARKAQLDPGRMVRMGEPSPLCPLTTPRDFFSFYVDNFDQFKVVWQTKVGIYEERPSDEQLALREEMTQLGIGRDPRKAAEGTKTWSSLGAEVNGEKGWIGSSLKFRRALLGANIKILGEDKVPCYSVNLQSVISKNMHSVQYQRALAALFDRLYVEMNQHDGKVLSNMAKDELWLLSMGLPMHWMNQRARVNGQVYATDASEDGGGACVTTGLTKWGHSRVHTLAHESGGTEGQAADPILVVECFAGMGGLKQALDLLGVVPMGVIAIDSNTVCAKVVRQQTRHVVWYAKIEDITLEEVKEWRRRYPRVKKVLLGGGWPCVNHSQLNVHRQGPEATTSQLLDRMLEVRDYLRQASKEVGLPEWEIMEMYENVVMDARDYKVQTSKIGFGGVFLEAAMVGRVRRPRIYWLKNLPFVPGLEGTCIQNEKMRTEDYYLPAIHIDTERPPLAWFLNEGSRKWEAEDEAFPTLTRPHPRKEPPSSPAGLDSASQKALARWRGDNYRLQPYWYEAKNMVLDKNGPRKLLPAEQLRLMGFPSTHLELKSKLSNDAKGQLIGNSFSAIAVARLLACLVTNEEEAQRHHLTMLLWQVWHRNEERVAKEDKPWKLRFGSSAVDAVGVGSLRQEVSSLAGLPPRQCIDPERRLTDEELLVYLLTRNGSSRGTDIRIDFGQPYSVGELTRHSIDPSSWTWKVLMSYAWKNKDQHINVLEMVAVLDLLRKLSRNSKGHESRLVVLVDNQVSLSVLTKGRSSAKALQLPLRRVAAVTLASGLIVCYGWVKSKWNPADGPSRWASRHRVA